MKAKLLIIFLLACLMQNEGWGQLPVAYRDKQITLRNVQSGMHMESNPSQWGTDCYQNYSNLANGYFNQGFAVENGVTPGFYRLRHLASGKYVTVITSPGYAEMRDLGSYGNSDNQEFEFVQQPTPYWYKLRSHFSHGGVHEVLCIDDGAGFNDGGIRLQTNKTVGNDSHQRWYLTILNPDANPSNAIPTLEDQYEGRTIGLTDNIRGFAWRGVPEGNNPTSIYANTNYPDFASQFKLEYTDEVGWYRIKHKASNTWVSVNGAYDGRPVVLRNFIDIQSESQKFKFIYKANGKYEIHSKYTQGPEIGNNAALLLQVHPTLADVQLYLGVDNTAGASSDGWQLFDIEKYINTALPAGFDGGASTLSGMITGKQYHITARETLAMLEPYIVGSDTFVRIQQNPVYGEQSEWVLDAGRLFGVATQTYRIRYGKTGQYLYLPSPTENATSGGLRLKLKKDNGGPDKRYEFLIQQNVPGPNWNVIAARVGESLIHTDDDGFVETATSNNPNNLYFQDRHFCFNLGMPSNENFTYAIITKKEGHFVSDSGNVGNNVAVIHAQYNDYACNWQFIPAGGTNTYYIKNQLTQQYLTTYKIDGVLSTRLLSRIGFRSNEDKWVLVRDGNYYKIQQAQPAGGNPPRTLSIRKGSNGGSDVFTFNEGTEPLNDENFIITRSNYSYLMTPLPLPVESEGILDNYVLNLSHALNNNAYLNDMMKNIGLPFEPSLQVSLYGTETGNQLLEDEGFATDGSAPSFLPVVKSALMFVYNYSSSKADSAIRNYKLDSAGHRIDITHALKKYLFEYLAPLDPLSWNAGEAALINWLDNKVRAIRISYGSRLDASWQRYKSAANAGEALTFSLLLDGPAVNSALFSDVEYFDFNEDQEASIMEYAGVNRAKGYKNPGNIAALVVPAVSGSGLTMLGFFAFRSLALPRVPAQAIAKTAVEATKLSLKAADKLISQTATDLVRPILHATSFSNVATAVSVIAVAIECIVVKAIEVAEFTNFENDLYEKVNRCNEPISLRSVALENKLQNKIALCQDLDYIFGTGKRFDNINGTVTYVFNGNGNWSDAANWLNGIKPPNPLPSNKEIIINPVTNGSCILNEPYALSPNNYNTRITVRPGKSFHITSTLTVPNAKMLKQ